MAFTDRNDAGRQLAELVRRRVARPAVVLAIPRGGVPVAVPVAEALGAPLDVIGVRKVGAPHRPELGVGAVAEGGGVFLDHDLLEQLRIDATAVEATVAAEQREVVRRVARYRGDRSLPAMTGSTVVLVDDGLATGVTARAAVRAVRNAGADRVVLAVPVASEGGRDALAAEADEVLCVSVPPHFSAVGQWYRRFDQTSDEEVLRALEGAGTHLRGDPP